MNRTAGIIVAVIVIAAAAAVIWHKPEATPSAASVSATVTDASSTDQMQAVGADGATSTITVTSDTSSITVVGASDVKTFTVSGDNFSFVPSTLSVRKGDTVKIIFRNANGFHDFKIDEFNVATARIQGGAETSVQFVADKAGAFDYYCSVGNHRAMGMQGVLTVTE